MLNNSNAVRFINTFLKVEHFNSSSERRWLSWPFRLDFDKFTDGSLNYLFDPIWIW